MAYIGRKPTNAPLTSADIQNGTITNDDLASGVAVANIGYTPANAANLSSVATSGSYTDLTNKPTIPTVPTTVSSFTNDSGYITSSALTPYQLTSGKNAANGYAGLDSSGLIPSTLLPSYVDDVLEYTNLAGFPGAGETGKIYVALDTNKTYRWSGSAYVEISASPGSTDSLVEGSVNLYFTDTRSRGAISATQNLTYNSTTGVITGPDLSGYLTSATATSTYQPLDGDLTAIGALTGTSGLLKKTAANTWALDTNTYLTSYTETDPVYTASSWYSKTAPTGTVVGTTDSQTLTNKTFTGYTETVYNLTGTDITPANGTIQYKTLGANTTFTESLADGQCVTLMLNPATYTVTWPTTTWVGSVASTAPTLVASVYNCITFFQIAGTLYGKYEGRV